MIRKLRKFELDYELMRDKLMYGKEPKYYNKVRLKRVLELLKKDKIKIPKNVCYGFSDIIFLMSKIEKYYDRELDNLNYCIERIEKYQDIPYFMFTEKELRRFIFQYILENNEYSLLRMLILALFKFI